MATPASPRLAQKQDAVDALVCTLYDTFRPKEEQPDGGEPQYRVAAMLPMKLQPHEMADDAFDMTNWERLDKYVREELQLEPDVTKMAISLKVSIKRSTSANPVLLQITNTSSLSIMRRQFMSMSLADIENTAEVALYVQKRQLFATVKNTKERKGKHAVQEKKAKDLSSILYGEGATGRQQQEGSWDKECDSFMAKDPVRAVAVRTDASATYT